MQRLGYIPDSVSSQLCPSTDLELRSHHLDICSHTMLASTGSTLIRAAGPQLAKLAGSAVASYHAIYDVGNSTNIKWHEGMVSTEQKEDLLSQKGCVLWFTGLSGSGKSTVACTLEHALYERGRLTALLDGDNIRHGLNKNLGFSAEDREENIRRIGEVGKLFADQGLITLVSFISPYRRDRDRARALCKPGRFIEVYMKVPIDICEQRDPKGLYKKARAGQLKGFTGIDDPYEEPENAELVLEAIDKDGKHVTPQVSAGKILEYLHAKQLI